MGHCCGTLLWDSLPALYYKVASSQLPAPPDKSHSRLHFAHSTHSRLHFAHSTRTISAEGCARMGQIALSPAFRALDTHDLRRGLRVKSPKRAFRTRLPQKLTRQSLQNERFVRDFLQKSSGNTHQEHTHHAALPSSFAIPAPPNNIRSHANPNGTATFTSTTTHNLMIPCACHESFPSTRLTRTKYCACHEMSPPSHFATSRFPAPATRIALPRFKARTKSCACHEK